MTPTLILGDCLEVMRAMPANNVPGVLRQREQADQRGAGMTCTWGPRWRPHRVAWYEFGVSHPECCEVPGTRDAGLAWGPDRHRRGMTGARTKLALAPSRSQ